MPETKLPPPQDDDEEEEEESWIEQYGIKFMFDPEKFTDIEANGKDFQGEYGTYKYIEPERVTDVRLRYKEIHSVVCLVSDRLILIGLVHASYLDKQFTILYQKFSLDIPWKKKKGLNYFSANSPNARKYLTMKLYDTYDPAEVLPLVNKAIQTIIELTEQELAARLKPE